MKPFDYFIFTLLLLTIFLASCKPDIKPGDLYGKWNYIKVEHPDATPPDSVRQGDLEFYKPYIQFTSDNKVVMMWGGKVLSRGIFTTQGQKIIIREPLDQGRTRAFPFWVLDLTDKKIVFETNVEDKARVTAVKE